MEHNFGVGPGHLPELADEVAQRHGCSLVNYTGPECYCGYGCAGAPPHL